MVLSETTTVLVADALPEGTTLRDLGAPLKDVPRAERLSQLDIAGLPNDFPPLRTSLERIGNLPDRVTSFVGRDQEIADLVELAADARLMTLTGPGGIGKTSLAIEVARRLEPRFPDGAWFVSLAALAGPDQVRSTIAHGIGIYDGPERAAASAVLSFLADRSMVLVLDNMEHLLDAADDVAAVVHASPGSRVLVTSRAPLRIAGEHEVPVAPLVDEGTALFVDRARAARVGWEPAEDREVIAEICHLLDGLPLGIELAAARVSTLSPTVIRDRLAARLPLPGSGFRDAPGASAHAGGSGRLEPRPPQPGSAGTAPSARRLRGRIRSRTGRIRGRAVGRGRRSTRRRPGTRRPEPDRRGADRPGPDPISHAPDDPVVRLEPVGRRWPRD